MLRSRTACWPGRPEPLYKRADQTQIRDAGVGAGLYRRLARRSWRGRERAQESAVPRKGEPPPPAASVSSAGRRVSAWARSRTEPADHTSWLLHQRQCGPRLLGLVTGEWRRGRARSSAVAGLGQQGCVGHATNVAPGPMAGHALEQPSYSDTWKVPPMAGHALKEPSQSID